MAYDPLNSPAYIAGTLTLTGGTPVTLLSLIQAQLEANATGNFFGVTITADAGNSAAVYIGAGSHLGGPLSATNFGYLLNAGGSAYRNSAGAGFSAPIGQIQVFAAANQTLHIEVF